MIGLLHLKICLCRRQKGLKSAYEALMASFSAAGMLAKCKSGMLLHKELDPKDASIPSDLHTAEQQDICRAVLQSWPSASQQWDCCPGM